MKIIMFVIMVCGQPDIIAWNDPQNGEYMTYWDDASQNMEAIQFFSRVNADPTSKVIVVEDKRNTCS